MFLKYFSTDAKASFTASLTSFCTSKSFIRGDKVTSTSTVKVMGFAPSASMLMFRASILFKGTFDVTYFRAASSATKHNSSICSLVNSGRRSSSTFFTWEHLAVKAQIMDVGLLAVWLANPSVECAVSLLVFLKLLP